MDVKDGEGIDRNSGADGYSGISCRDGFVVVSKDNSSVEKKNNKKRECNAGCHSYFILETHNDLSATYWKKGRN